MPTFAIKIRSDHDLRALLLDSAVREFYFVLGFDILEVKEDASQDELIELLGLKKRTYGGLKRLGVHTVSDLLAKSEAELSAIPNFGRGSLDDVIEALHGRGESLRKDDRRTCF